MIELLVNIDDKVKTLQVEDGENLLDVLRKNNIMISAPCGGTQNCGKCKVKILGMNNNGGSEYKTIRAKKAVCICRNSEILLSGAGAC